MHTFRMFARQRAVATRWLGKRRAILLVALVTLITLGLRLYAAPRLPIDTDERVYLRAALHYADLLRDGQWRAVTWYDANTEHPLFYKLVYSAALLTQPRLDQLWTKDMVDGMPMWDVPVRPWGMTGRYVSVAFGTLAGLALAALNPMAGLFFAVDTLAIQYSSSMFLEALPLLTSLLAGLSYLRWYRLRRRELQSQLGNSWHTWIWLALSAVLLGTAAASKYTFGVAALAIGLHFADGLRRREIPASDLWKLAAWGAAAGLVFLLCNPYLWTRHPGERLLDSLLYHQRYSQSDRVRGAHYPFYQPLVWLSAPFTSYRPHAHPAFMLQLDLLIGLLALAGLPRLYARQRLFFFWLVSGLGVLLLWPTKWPQYTMIIIIPLCLSAGLGANGLHDRVKALLVMPHQRRITAAAQKRRHGLAHALTPARPADPVRPIRVRKAQKDRNQE